MLNEKELQNLAKHAADKRLPEFHVSRVLTEPTVDSEGNEALRVVFVLAPDAVDAIDAENALQLLVDLHNELMRKGDDRFPIIEYATEADLEESVDSDADADVDDEE